MYPILLGCNVREVIVTKQNNMLTLLSWAQILHPSWNTQIVIYMQTWRWLNSELFSADNASVAFGTGSRLLIMSSTLCIHFCIC